MNIPTRPAPGAETLRPREREILAAIRPVFAAKGFDAASMQDLARAAGMSVGNFYRYFPSRAAIVAAIIQVDLEEVEGVLRAALHQRVHDELCSCEDATLWAEITSAALRKPEIAEAVTKSIPRSYHT